MLSGVIRAKQPQRLPVVLTRSEVALVLKQLKGDHWLMASLMYGAGLRLMECLRLRVKDLDFERRSIVVREGKGARDRVTVLPEQVCSHLERHLAKVRSLHERDLQEGYGTVHLPYALECKYPHANRAWGWQYVFPAHGRAVDPRAGIMCMKPPCRRR